MLKEHEKWLLPDEGGKNQFFAEVNFNDKEEVKDCKIVRFTFPDGSESHVNIKYLMEILFACGKPEDQQKLIPQTLETIHHYKTTLGIKAAKDISRGEMINFPLELSIPCSALREDVIGSLPKEYKRGKFGGIGNGKLIN